MAPSESVTFKLEDKDGKLFTFRSSSRCVGGQTQTLLPHSSLITRVRGSEARTEKLVPEGVVPRHQAGQGENGGVGGDLLLPQRAFHLLPVPRHHPVVVGAL